MAHFPKPFFKASRNTWYVQLEGRQVNLGPDRDAAFRSYHELMAQRDQPVRQSDDAAVCVVLDLFLEWCQNHKAARTYDWYLAYLQSFVGTIPGDLAVRDLKPFHVQRWLDGKPGWRTGKRGATVAVQRALNWAVKSGYVSKNPVKDMERPQPSRREVFLTAEQFAALCAAVRDRDFLDVLEACWDTGCRPNELMVVEAAHVDLDGRRWVLPVEKSKGKKRSRVVYLTDRALEITKRRMAAWKSGPIFRNTDGAPWTRFALNCRFARLKEKTRIACSLYALRHSWATRMLASGKIDAVTAAMLLGHKDTAMISRFYAHLTQLPDHLRQAARKAGGDAAAP